MEGLKEKLPEGGAAEASAPPLTITVGMSVTDEDGQELYVKFACRFYTHIHN